MIHSFKDEQAFKLFTVIHPTIEEDDVALIQDTNTVYIYKDKQWSTPKLKSNNNGVKLTLKELNQQIMEQVPALKQADINDAIKLINTFAAQTHQKHFMFMCPEHKYYTLLEQSKHYEFGSLGAAIFACCENIGEVKSVSLNDCSAIEVWITDDTSTECYYLFAYDDGMVYFA